MRSRRSRPNTPTAATRPRSHVCRFGGAPRSLRPWRREVRPQWGLASGERPECKRGGQARRRARYKVISATHLPLGCERSVHFCYASRTSNQRGLTLTRPMGEMRPERRGLARVGVPISDCCRWIYVVLEEPGSRQLCSLRHIMKRSRLGARPRVRTHSQ